MTDSGIFLSANNGISWTTVNSGLANNTVSSLTVSGGNIFAGTVGSGIFLSTNNGTSWKAVNSGLPFTSTNIQSLAGNGSTIFAGTDDGVYLSINNGTIWTAMNSGLTNTNVHCLALSGNNIYAGTDHGLFFSNNSSRWTAYVIDTSAIQTDTGLNQPITALAVIGSTIFAGTSAKSAGVAMIGKGGIFRSTNNGTNWTEADKGFISFFLCISSFTVSGNNIFVGGYDWQQLGDLYQRIGFGVNLSTNNGDSWSYYYSGLPTFPWVHSFAVCGSTIFAAVTNLDAFNNGGGIYRSTNNGISWIESDSGITNSFVNSLAVSGSNIFAGTNNGMFLSTNNGNSWIAVNSGLTNTVITSFLVSGGTIYAGTDGGGVWRRPISEMVGIINDKQQTLSPISTDFNLATSAQSNHNIAISFFLSQSQPVDLNIYNVSGREVARSANRNLEAGKHSISWDTRDMAAGCYAVRMQAGSHVYVKNILVSR